MVRNKLSKIILSSLAISIVIFLVFLSLFIFLPVEYDSEDFFWFNVAQNSNIKDVASELVREGIIRNEISFRFSSFVKGLNEIEYGAYLLSPSMSLFSLIDTFSQGPEMVRITIQEGLRKEEIVETLVESLKWEDIEKVRFTQGYETVNNALSEGMYYPDTYLIPIESGGEEVAVRMISRFQEVFSELAEDFIRENVRWDTALRLASIIQREASGSGDMALVSGILWNRLLEGQRLEVDATLQYIVGEVDGRWWSSVDIESKNLDSPYNTYMYTGLPPAPISNPGLSAIRAVLHPEETDCYFYLHDINGNIHCSIDYDGHLDNIDKYL